MPVLPDGAGPASKTRRRTQGISGLKPRKSSTGSNLADMGREVVRDHRREAGSTPELVGFAGEEAAVKVCGVAVAMLPGQELGA